MVSGDSPLAGAESVRENPGGRPSSRPDANEEYLLYQTLVGTWPLYPMNPEEHEAYVRRIDGYMQKALHEAKVHTSWVNPNNEYEQAVTKFVERVLEPSPGNVFLAGAAPISSADREGRNVEFARAAGAENRFARRAGFLSGQRSLGLRSGGSRQPARREL